MPPQKKVLRIDMLLHDNDRQLFVSTSYSNCYNVLTQFALRQKND